MNEYLGVLCKRGHDYNQTGMSLRNAIRSECVECKKIISRNYVKRNRARHNLQTNKWNKKRRREDPFQYLCVAIKARCKKKDLPFDLNSAFLRETLEKQNGLCYWLKVPIDIHQSKSHPNKATIDRLIPELGYLQNNVVWASSFANRGRVDVSVEEFKKFLGCFLKNANIEEPK